MTGHYERVTVYMLDESGEDVAMVRRKLMDVFKAVKEMPDVDAVCCARGPATKVGNGWKVGT